MLVLDPREFPVTGFWIPRSAIIKSAILKFALQCGRQCSINERHAPRDDLRGIYIDKTG